ncbi:MAG: valine--tRNA ligase [bacterium]
MEIAPKYDPKDVEGKWYAEWKLKQYFHALADKDKKPFTIVIPPPNITGSLHMGHALNNILQDILVRSKRMQGFNALWVPGTDHGGIATQNIVEKMLKAEGSTRQKLGRESFLERMEIWSKDTKYTILNQLEKLGCSCDWDRKRFTMDEQCSKAVLTAFERLYSRGLIYRGEHIVDWCPRCGTALNESEVEHEQEKSKLWYIRYPLEGKKDKFITVATTRPETMLGDTAVAVHPKDKRYKKMIGKKLILPLVDREIPVVADDAVSPEFGTGAVKVTPAHDPNDWEIAKRNKLVSIQVIDKEAKIMPMAGCDLDGKRISSSQEIISTYVGLDRYKVREKLVLDLKEKGFLEKEEDYSVPITRCYRCNCATEPLVSEQWYLKTKEMAQEAIKVAKEGKTSFVPDNWMKPYLMWLEKLHDWCISRQIWWGHRIPAWYCEDKLVFRSKVSSGDKGAQPVIGTRKQIEEQGLEVDTYYLKPGSTPDRIGGTSTGTCPECGSCTLHRDPDVLDTWFSSALWPFSTLGWPEKTEDLEHFYPTSVLVTGHEIIYLWVARMIMMGLTLADDIPFSHIYIHGIVRDEKGKKMSKSLGNVIDPLEVTAKYGTDALRFTLATHGVMGRDLQLSEDTFGVSKHFCNKLWNASRFVMMNLEGFHYKGIENIEKDNLLISDRWIISEYNKTVREVTRSIDEYNLSEAARLLYDFFWSKFCDWYVELVKPRLYADDNDAPSRKVAQSVLVYVLEGTMRLLHPFMCFITEEIWQVLGKMTGGLSDAPSIMISSWPKYYEKYADDEATQAMTLVMDIITAIRNVRGEMRINIKKELDIVIKLDDEDSAGILKTNQEYISRLAKVASLKIGKDIDKPDSSATQVVGNMEIYIPLKGVLDLELEKERLGREIAKIDTEIEKISGKLQNKSFVEKAPQKEVERVKGNMALFEEKKKKLKINADMLK